MKLTVCELSSTWTSDTREQEALMAHLAAEKSDFLLLPEMPFSRWLASERQADPRAWETAVRAHEQWTAGLDRFNVGIIAGTRPILKGDTPLNQAFVWTAETGLLEAHEKYYLPDEEGFWEATWYCRGSGEFRTIRVAGITIGFLICTELWFNHHARDYGRAGMDILVCPRATPTASTDTWVAGGRAAANVSGAFCLSSNYNGPNTANMDFGGTGWMIEPEEGAVLGLTTRSAPFLTLEADLSAARDAKATYPRYVTE